MNFTRFHSILPHDFSFYNTIMTTYSQNKREIDELGFMTFQLPGEFIFDINNMPMSFASRSLGDIWPDMAVAWEKTTHIPYANGRRVDQGEGCRITGKKWVQIVENEGKWVKMVENKG